jgi:hypothetical protein
MWIRTAKERCMSEGSERATGKLAGYSLTSFASQIIHMVDHGDEEIEEHSPTTFHLCLHCSRSFESGTAADYESKVMSTETTVSV